MSDTFRFHGEIDLDLQKIVDEQVRKVQRHIDKATLDQVAGRLADFGYVKVDDKSRWLELFGTPERAARTLAGRGTDCYCCPVRDAGGHDCADFNCLMNDHDALLEWLKGASDGE